MRSSSTFDVTLDGLRIRYPDRDRPALDGVTETIAAGETVVITGPSGCGKSTLCRAIGGFVPELISADVEGEILVGEDSVWTTDSARIAQRVGYVQQDADAQICTLRVEREVAFGPENLCLPRGEIDRRVDASLSAVGIEHLRNRETTDLSGGEKQRLAIASILAMQPQVLLLDEPTANLDPEGARSLFELLRRLRTERGTTLVIVEHRLCPVLGLEPRFLVLDRGRLVERHAGEHIAPRALGTTPRKGERTLRSERLLSVERLSFAYEAPLLSDLTFEVRRGEIVGVIGPNGGGKTTLLRLIAGLVEPDGGKIERECGALGFAFQHPHHQIFERTVRGELLIDGSERDSGEIEASLEEGRLGGLGGVPPLSLSLGEQRRLTLVAALRRRPDLLLLDEPFIGQDWRNVAWIVSRLRAHCDAGGAAIVVTHDIPLLRALADRLLFVDYEPILGSPSDVFDRLRAAGRDAFHPEAWGAVG